jgi:2-polyprenyl-3-methyl-5-hydroxy-6-metoxy-1,4-benzoquinol methylase
MWRVNGAYAFHAHDAGAAAVTAPDVSAETPEFRAGNAERGNRVRFVQANVNDGAVAETVSPHEVVFCSGVLYHVPNPILTLARLRALCADTLILDTATIPERDAPQSAIRGVVPLPAGAHARVPPERRSLVPLS